MERKNIAHRFGPRVSNFLSNRIVVFIKIMISDILGFFMEAMGTPWDPMGPLGTPWGPRGTNGNPWKPMGTLGFSSFVMVFYSFIIVFSWFFQRTGFQRTGNPSVFIVGHLQ